MNSVLSNVLLFKNIFSQARMFVFVVMLILLMSVGCKLGPNFESNPPPLPTDWQEFKQEEFSDKPSDELEWWKTFNDPVLESLIQEAFEQNPNMHIASLRIVQSRIGRTVSKQSLLPLITGSGSVTHTKQSESVKPDVEVSLSGPPPSADALATLAALPIPKVSISPKIDVYDIGFDAVWEMDIWGKKRRKIEAATATMQATYADYDDIMVSLAGEVAATYIQRQVLAQRLTTLKGNVEYMKDFLAKAEAKFENGETPESDVALVQSLVSSVSVGIPRIEQAMRESENALCILLGKAPQDLSEQLGDSTAIPTVPPTISTGIPADLLRRRPDVRAAEKRAHAQCARIGAAKASILPSFKLLGIFGWQSSDSDNLFDHQSRTWTYGGAIGITKLINYPLTVEFVRLADVQFEEAMAEYNSVVLKAAMEVENSMISLIKSRDEQAILDEGEKAANRSATLGVAAYEKGEAIVSIPLAALTFKANLQDQAIAARGKEAINTVAIFKALGGGWESRQGRELLPENIRERMKERSDWWSFSGKKDLSTQ